MSSIKINSKILNYIKNHKPRTFDFIPEEGSEWKIDRITRYPNVNGGFPVVELSNESGDCLILPKSLIDLEDLTDV